MNDTHRAYPKELLNRLGRVREQLLVLFSEVRLLEDMVLLDAQFSTQPEDIGSQTCTAEVKTTTSAPLEKAPRNPSVEGAALRSLRKQKDWTLEAVESLSKNRFSKSWLSDAERGLRLTSVTDLSDLLALYGMPVNVFYAHTLQSSLEDGASLAQTLRLPDVTVISGETAFKSIVS